MPGEKILIVEDEAGIRMTLKDRLNAEGYVVSEAADGITGEGMAIKSEYDLIILDLMLPGRDGLAVCSNIRKAGKMIPVLMLTARSTNLDVIVGLRSGADDYLAKPFDAGILIARIEALLRRASAGTVQKNGKGSLVKFGAFTLDREKGELLFNKKSVELNAQEYRLLDYLASNPDKLLTREQILDEVWEYGAETTTRTIDVHIAKLRQHLGESDYPKHIRTIRGRGYKFMP
jgi:DNA-binding response OmpR family regulator